MTATVDVNADGTLPTVGVGVTPIVRPDVAEALVGDGGTSQPLDADLTTIGGLSPSNDDILQRKAGAWSNRTIAQLLTDLAAAGTTFQPLDSDLTAIAALTTTATGRSLLAAADAAAIRTIAGAETSGAAAAAAAASQPLDSDLTAIAALTTTSFGRGLLAKSGYGTSSGDIAEGNHTHAGSSVDPVFLLFGTPDSTFEFDTSSLTGLTAIGSPTTENANTSVPGALFYKDATASTAFMGRYLASPSMPFTIITRMLDSTLSANYNTCGLIVGVADPSTGKFITCSSQWHNLSGPYGSYFTSEIMTNRTTYSSTAGSTGGANGGSTGFLAMVANSTTSIDCYWSRNGWAWKKFVTAANPSLTVGSIGLVMRSESSAGLAVAFDYLRIWNSAKTFPNG